MIIKKIIRSYSKSINAKNYGAPESWVKVEATAEAEVESNDDSKIVSDILHNMVKTDVLESVKAITDAMRGIKQEAPKTENLTTGPTGQQTSQDQNSTSQTSNPAPAASTAQPATATTANTTGSTEQQPSNTSSNKDLSGGFGPAPVEPQRRL